MSEREPRHSPSSRALKALLPAVVAALESEALGERKIHRTDTYRWARAATTPNAERAATIEEVARVPANGWTPDGLGEDGPQAQLVHLAESNGDSAA